MAETRFTARPAASDTYVPSILDRLTAPESFGHGPSLGFHLRQLIEAVRRDLEDLLNTRQTHQGLDERLVELNDSIMAYGLPDFSELDGTKPGAQRQIGTIIEEIVNRFEPRLRDVRAIPSEKSADDRSVLSVRIHIAARLRIEPYPDVTFESVIELTSGKASISAGDS
jgi:type VI secretion system protein ImpF